jgi:hypothetical protein
MAEPIRDGVYNVHTDYRQDDPDQQQNDTEKTMLVHG